MIPFLLGLALGGTLTTLAAKWHISTLEQRLADERGRVTYWQNRTTTADARLRRYTQPHPLSHRVEQWASVEALIAPSHFEEEG